MQHPRRFNLPLAGLRMLLQPTPRSFTHLFGGLNLHAFTHLQALSTRPTLSSHGAEREVQTQQRQACWDGQTKMRLTCAHKQKRFRIFWEVAWKSTQLTMFPENKTHTHTHTHRCFPHEFLFKDQLYCPASFCHQKAPSVSRQSGLPFFFLLSQRCWKQPTRCSPSAPSTVFKDKDKAHAGATTFFTHTFNPRIYQKCFRGTI